jgi:hypothetical protein
MPRVVVPRYTLIALAYSISIVSRSCGNSHLIPTRVGPHSTSQFSSTVFP